MIKNNMTRQLLNMFLELYALCNDIEKWKLANFINNPPRLYRLQAIDALMKALQIKFSYQEFLYGEFLTEQSNLNQTEFLIKIKVNFPTLFQATQIDEKELIDFQFIFEVLFSYRMKLQNLISMRNSVIECSVPNSYLMAIFDKINNKLQDDINRIDNVLSYLINPKEIHFSMQDLIKNYNYPSGNLTEIDNDWL